MGLPGAVGPSGLTLGVQPGAGQSAVLAAVHVTAQGAFVAQEMQRILWLV